MKNIPLAVTAVSVAALMGAHANAVPTGNPMDYTQAIIIDAPPGSTFLDGTGAGTGTGVFDTDGTLSVQSAVSTSIVFGTAVGTVSASTIYQGSVSGNTWTYSGTTTSQITGCTGAGVICSNAVPGPPTTTTGNPIFTVDILNGGTWSTTSMLATATLSVDHELVPIIPPGPAPVIVGIPTMSAYGLGITAIGLFGAAAVRLRSSKKRK